MSRQWKIVVSCFAFALALSGCSLCSDVRPSAELSPAPVQHADFTPAPPAHESAPGGAAVSCMVGEFPLSSSRLNNVDKACLDDVVQRLKADPRAHVVVIGHADGHERNVDALARDRARAVQEYLAQESGVDSYRVKVRSLGAGRPLDEGTDDMSQARNRRCEVWFVPEGASDPN